MKFKQSLLSATCLAASRKALNLSNIWTLELEKLTQYSYEEIVDPLNELWIQYENGYKKESMISWRCTSYRN